MFELTQSHLKSLHGDGGEPFRRFVNDLIRAEAFTCGIPLSQLNLQIRASVGDGGVDAGVATAIPNAKSGWFQAPTCWQYKTTTYTTTDALIKEIKSEMQKNFASQRIAEGHAYRFCMLESIPEQTVVTKIQSAMLEAATAICTKLPQLVQTPRLVHGGDLASWAGMYPAVGIRVQGLSGDFQLFSPWLQNQQTVTTTYVPNPAWAQITDQIRKHVDFANPPIGNDACFSIAGNSGVGKTRLVAETLCLIYAADALVIQTDVGEVALRIASELSHERHQHAILVVDECSPDTLFDLRQRLRSFTKSVRVVAIEHLDRIPIHSPEEIGPWLTEPGTQTTLEILNQNFPTVTLERRNVYGRISEGFIRFAADLCDHDAEIDINAMTGSPNSIYAYLQKRLGSNDADIVGSLALFSKIGYRDDVDGELTMLASMTGISVADYRKSIGRLRLSPGFVAQRGRYWYVTPEIVTRSLFQHGWRRFVESDIHSVLTNLTPEHMQQLQSRANAYGGKEVASQLADYFREKMNHLTIQILADSRVTQFVLAVAESDPTQFMPKLTHIVCSSTDEELAILDSMPNSTTWSSRRYLIFFLEKAALFPEYFSHAERALLRLAQYETEPQIGNNATTVWTELFRLRLSGTAADFSDRLAILRGYLCDPAKSRIAARAFQEAIGRPGAKVASPRIFAGRSVPDTWRPGSLPDEQQCLRNALQMCGEVLSGETSAVSNQLFDAIYNSLDWLIYRGVGEVAQRIVSASRLSDSNRRRLYNLLTEYVRMNFEARELNTLSASEVISFLTSWAEELAPKSLGEQMRSLIACDSWDERFNPEMKGDRGVLTEIAEEFILHPQLLEAEFGWLASDEAQSIRRLGYALGQLDTASTLATLICDDSRIRKHAGLLAGYVSGIMSRSDEVAAIIDDTVALFCENQPAVALELLQVGGDAINGHARLNALIENGRVEPCQTVGFAHHYGKSAMSVDQFNSTLKLLIAKSSESDGRQPQCVVRFTSLFESMYDHFHPDQRLFDSPDLVEQVVRVLDMTKGDVTSRITSEWTALAKLVVKAGRNDVLPMFNELLFSRDITTTQHALETLAELAVEYSAEVMETFGNALMDKRGIYLRVHVCSDLVAAIDKQLILSWLEQNGDVAAEALARHLPQPFLDENGGFVVPELLDCVFERFGTDAVLSSFHAGLNSTGSYFGDLSPVLRERAERFKTLLNHSNPAIRRFANEEIVYLTNWEKNERRREEEESILS